jgi:hypothetical protein
MTGIKPSHAQVMGKPINNMKQAKNTKEIKKTISSALITDKGSWAKGS